MRRQERQEIRESLTAWCRAAGFVHALLNTKPEALARGEILRLAVFMPPKRTILSGVPKTPR
jgi:hypothetical protein